MILLQSAGSGDGFSSFLVVLALFTILVIILIVLAKERLGRQYVSHWHHYVEDLNQTPLDFYERVSNNIKENKTPDVRIRHHTYSKKAYWFSGSRLYLQVSSKGYFFIIGAAPYGNGFFVSYWQVENRTVNESMLRSIPLLGNLIANALYNETFFTFDTRVMYQKMIHSCVINAVDAECTAKGLRMMTETERMVQLEPFYKK